MKLLTAGEGFRSEVDYLGYPVLINPALLPGVTMQLKITKPTAVYSYVFITWYIPIAHVVSPTSVQVQKLRLIGLKLAGPARGNRRGVNWGYRRREA